MVLVGGGVCLGDVGVVGEGVFYFAELDAEAADLDLVVGAAEVLEPAVGGPAGEVAGAVHPGAGRRRTGRGRSAGGQGGAAEVAAGEAGAGDVEFAGYTGRHRPQPVVQHIHPRVRDGHADGWRARS